MAMAATGVTVGGCNVFLGHPNPGKAMSEAKNFKTGLTATIARSRCVNMGDMYRAHFNHLEKMNAG